MGLSNDLISQFVRATLDSKKDTKKETLAYGTVVKKEKELYVKIGGSDTLTPVLKTTGISENDLVLVLIKNHTATVIGNVTSPSINDVDVNNLYLRVDTLEANEVKINDKLSANEGYIGDLRTDILNVNNTLTARIANVEELNAKKIDAIVVESDYAKITDLDATNAYIHDLESAYGEFVNLTTENFEAVNGTIDSLDTKYANLDFSNIGKAAMEYFYANSGLIKDVTISNGTITGNLVGVTISGDLIEGNTIVAEKLVIKGDDGLYYKLNTDGMAVEAQQTDRNSLNGTVIKAQSITASKISVDDLVAFDATIGGFNITENSIYSGVKETVGNTTRGIYLDNTGQVAFGDSNNFIKYFKDQNGNYKLNISADTILFNSGTDLNETISTLELTSEGLTSRLNNQKVGGTNILRSTNTVTALGTSSSWANGTWRSAGGGTGTRTVIDISDAPNADVKKGFRIVGDDTDTTTAQNYVPVTAGVEYTLSCYARGSGTLRIQVGKSPYSSITYTLTDVSNWTKYTYTFIAGEGNSVTDGNTNVYFGNRGTGTLEMCGFKLEVGNVSTDWTPSPYDVDKKTLEAAKTATNYLNFSSGGLVVGDMTASTLGNNVLIDSDSVDIRNGTATLASFGANYLYLAKNSRNAKIDLCNGLATLYHESKYSYDTVFIIDTGNTTEVMSNTSTPLCVTSGNTNFPKVSVQFAIGEEIVGGLGIVKSTSTDNSLVRMGKNLVKSYTVLDTGNYYNVMDSGWINGGVIGEKFTLYDNDYQIQYRKIGKMVEMRGVIKPVTTITGSTTNYEIFTLQEGYRPAKYLYERCQGSGGYSWLLSITTGGVVRFARYTDGSKWVDATIDSWLPFHVTFFVD